MTINCNFGAVFAQFESVEEVKNVANAIRDELINAFNARVKELGGDKQKKAGMDVTVSATEEKPKKQPTKKDEKKAEKGAKKPETKAEKKPVKKQEKKADKKDDVAQIALTDTKAVKKMGFVWKSYSDKSFVLSTDADTKCLRKALEALGGSWNGRLKDCGAGSYIFSKAKSEKEVKKAMKGLYKKAV